MATPSGNIPPSQIVNSSTEYFNNYFSTRFTTSPDINDAVVGYFQTITGNADAGKLLASTVIYTALSRGIEPMSLVDEFKKLRSGKVVKTKSPIRPENVVSTFTSYQQIVDNKNNYEVGMLFYIYSLKVFYRSVLNEANEEIYIEAVDGYTAEVVYLPNNETTFNFYYVQTTVERDDITPYLTVLLNTNRVNTSLLGISNSPQVNKYIQRAIRP